MGFAPACLPARGFDTGARVTVAFHAIGIKRPGVVGYRASSQNRGRKTSAVGSNGAKVCGAAEKIAPKLARPFCYNTAYQHPSNLIFYGFRPLVFNQGTVSSQKNQAAFLRPRRFMVPAVALATSKITVLLSG